MTVANFFTGESTVEFLNRVKESLYCELKNQPYLKFLTYTTKSLIEIKACHEFNFDTY